MLIWSIFLISVGVASARNIEYVSPEYLEALRSSGQDEEFARLLGVDVKLVRPIAEQRSEDSRMNFVSPLGDILLSEEQERQGIDLSKYGGNRWKNSVIPYTILKTDFTPDQIKIINNVIADFNKKVTNLQILPRKSEQDYVQVFSGSGCYSQLGKVYGPQPLSLQSDKCLTNGTVQHEFVHAAGIAHEHNRADRDDHIKVLWDNIREEWKSQYEKVNPRDFPNIGEYDYDSVMHYTIRSPDNWYKDAFELPPGIDRKRLGQDIGVSPGDIYKLNTMYSCRIKNM